MFKNISLAILTLFIFDSCAIKQQKLGVDDWYAFTKSNNAKQEPSKVYEFKDEMIRMYGDENSCLMTHKTYKDFELSLEFRWNIEEKFNKKKSIKNSGVMYNIPVDAADRIWPKGMQFQIKENCTGDFIFLDQLTAKVNGKFIEAGASVVSAKFLANENPYGQWNSLVIKSYKGKVTHYLNGKLVNECVEATATSGKISLNYESSPIDFKNISIKNISKN